MIRTLRIAQVLFAACVLFISPASAQKGECTGPACTIECYPRKNVYERIDTFAIRITKQMRERKERGEIGAWKLPHGGYDIYGLCADDWQWLVYTYKPDANQPKPQKTM